MSDRYIFFDNASTTKMFDCAIKKMSDVCEKYYYNPSALYRNALDVQNIISQSRLTLAKVLGASENEIYFTSCATESNNWVFNSGFKNKKGNVVISKGEHASVYESAIALKSKGYDVRLVEINGDGTINLEDLHNKLDENTSLVSIIHCSNEVGVINDLPTISKIIKTKSKAALFHSDGVQAFAKLKTDMNYCGVDLYTISAHKLGGAKGVGALYIRNGVKLAPFISGGGQEQGMRSGTENTPAIAAFGEAVKYFSKAYDSAKIRQIRNYIIERLTEQGFVHNGNDTDSGFIISLSKQGLKSEILSHMLCDENILIGLGSACSSKAAGNRVLEAMGKSRSAINGNIRISLSIDSTLHESEILCEAIARQLNTLQNRLK